MDSNYARFLMACMLCEFSYDLVNIALGTLMQVQLESSDSQMAKAWLSRLMPKLQRELGFVMFDLSTIVARPPREEDYQTLHICFAAAGQLLQWRSASPEMIQKLREEFGQSCHLVFVEVAVQTACDMVERRVNVLKELLEPDSDGRSRLIRSLGF